MIVFTSKAMGSSLWIYGFLTGMGGGFFWANKNYLSLILSRGSNRLYYNSLESSVMLIIRIVIPLLAGFIISFGSKSGFYLPVLAYQLLMVLGVIALIVSSYIINKSTIADIKHEPLLIKRVTRRWNFVRGYIFLFNVIYGAEYVIPTVLVLTLLGQEGTLGLITSATAALSAASLYILGRKGDISHVFKTVAAGNIIYAFSVIFLGIFFSPLTALIYLAGMTIGKALRFSPLWSWRSWKRKEAGQYYIFDNDFVQFSRILGLCLVLLFATYGQEFALRFLPTILGLVAIINLMPLRSMIHSLKD
jgi:YQGE family putative transporter